MKTDVKEKNEKVIISLDGRLDTASTGEFEEAIQPFLTREGVKILIDCDKLVYICSSGLRSFMLLLKNVTKNSGSLMIENMRSEIKEVFDMTGFSSIFNIKDKK